MAPSVSPLLVALSLLCNLAVFALLANTHIELGAVRAAAAASQPRRGLLEPPPAVDDSFGVRLERLEESLGARVAALEQRTDGLSARVDGADTLSASLVERIVELERAAPRAASERTATDRAADSDGRTTVPLDERVVEQLAQSERRRAQGAEPEPEPEPEVGDLVKIIKPQTVRCGGPGDTTANDIGAFDYGLCESDPAFAACHAAACAGHKGRRQLQGDGYGDGGVLRRADGGLRGRPSALLQRGLCGTLPTVLGRLPRGARDRRPAARAGGGALRIDGYGWRPVAGGAAESAVHGRQRGGGLRAALLRALPRVSNVVEH
jgi:hypothetical protein